MYGDIRGNWGGIGIAGADRGWYDLNEFTTDEALIPTREDGAWADNGIWRALYQHTWTSSQPFMENTWNWLYRQVFRANLAVEILTENNAPEEVLAEAHVLRAYFYYLLMDGWGSVPFYTENNLTLDQIPQASRAEIYNYVQSTLVEWVPKLSETVGGSYYGRMNKWAGYALLTKVYLNAEVYSGTARWNEAINASDMIINSGLFSLQSDLYDNAGDEAVFGDVLSDNEVILAMFVDAINAPRNIIGIRTLRGPHGDAQFGIQTWNGATVHENFLNKYEEDDKRKGQWLLGPQPGLSEGYTATISSITSAGVNEGARNAKFLPVPPFDGNGSTSNDFPIFRYADVLLMKAEAMLRNGSGDATSLVNEVRTRAGVESLSSVTLMDVYDERGRELAWEGHRRQDMIRFGTFTEPHDFKAASSDHLKVFPIPAAALAENPGLTQNPNY
jgi:hypothetical protein